MMKHADTQEKLLYAITRGTTSFERRHDEKHIRVRHFERSWALVQWCGSSYSCRGWSNYVPGHISFYRLDADVQRLMNGFDVWSTMRGEHGVFTDKRCKVWVNTFRDRFIDRIDFSGNSLEDRQALRKLLNRCTILANHSLGRGRCSGLKDYKTRCNFVPARKSKLCDLCTSCSLKANK